MRRVLLFALMFVAGCSPDAADPQPLFAEPTWATPVLDHPRLRFTHMSVGADGSVHLTGHESDFSREVPDITRMYRVTIDPDGVPGETEWLSYGVTELMELEHALPVSDGSTILHVSRWIGDPGADPDYVVRMDREGDILWRLDFTWDDRVHRVSVEKNDNVYMNVFDLDRTRAAVIKLDADSGAPVWRWEYDPELFVSALAAAPNGVAVRFYDPRTYTESFHVLDSDGNDIPLDGLSSSSDLVSEVLALPQGIAVVERSTRDAEDGETGELSQLWFDWQGHLMAEFPIEGGDRALVYSPDDEPLVLRDDALVFAADRAPYATGLEDALLPEHHCSVYRSGVSGLGTALFLAANCSGPDGTFLTVAKY